MASYIDDILERASRATPGPWRNDCGNGQVETEDARIEICNRVGNSARKEDVAYRFGVEVPNDVASLLSFDNEDDMDFIAAARTDVVVLANRLRTALTILSKIAASLEPLTVVVYELGCAPTIISPPPPRPGL